MKMVKLSRRNGEEVAPRKIKEESDWQLLMVFKPVVSLRPQTHIP
jgi:hypothetical protein